jgi:hypothetical protein
LPDRNALLGTAGFTGQHEALTVIRTIDAGDRAQAKPADRPAETIACHGVLPPVDLTTTSNRREGFGLMPKRIAPETVAQIRVL